MNKPRPRSRKVAALGEAQLSHIVGGMSEMGEMESLRVPFPDLGEPRLAPPGGSLLEMGEMESLRVLKP